jgi:hypothetical protein
MQTKTGIDSIVTEDQKPQFREDGYFILDRCVPPWHLELLRENCQGFIDAADAEMNEKGHMDCPMYLTCWVTLDDVTLENGTVCLLPYSQLGIRTVVKHLRDPKTNDMVGYFGKQEGVPVVIPAGSIAVFSSYVFHRSGPNLTDRQRRVYLPQYSPSVILNGAGKPWGQKIPFLKAGEIVWKPGVADGEEG